MWPGNVAELVRVRAMVQRTEFSRIQLQTDRRSGEPHHEPVARISTIADAPPVLRQDGLAVGRCRFGHDGGSETLKVHCRGTDESPAAGIASLRPQSESRHLSVHGGRAIASSRRAPESRGATWRKRRCPTPCCCPAVRSLGPSRSVTAGRACIPGPTCLTGMASPPFRSARTTLSRPAACCSTSGRWTGWRPRLSISRPRLGCWRRSLRDLRI